MEGAPDALVGNVALALAELAKADPSLPVRVERCMFPCPVLMPPRLTVGGATCAVFTLLRRLCRLRQAFAKADAVHALLGAAVKRTGAAQKVRELRWSRAGKVAAVLACHGLSFSPFGR